MQRELELIKEPSSGQVIKRSSFLGSIWTQIWTWLHSNPVFGFYGVEIFIKYVGILFTYYIIILGGVGGPKLAKSWWCYIWTLPNSFEGGTRILAGTRFRRYQEQGWFPLQICCHHASWYLLRSQSLFQVGIKYIADTHFEAGTNLKVGTNVKVGTNLYMKVDTSFEGGTRILDGTRFEVGIYLISI